ncbi:unnamed protein product [Didymodactylos carnosus]|uniref:Uncharacterized protein n=1 Tax=Didymodactylos carnosus TaxID=1234261 RepID=A0A815S7I0_9BILA|nr:unnamed protein product [Didymodactylos carnosus]CAF1486454.1 unnamed protein product [Didymodactylos carnosus]CAF3993965.1 unnamed protein product [Didymodactylos carnosus]CAF4350408.1 unnamed protein product [Didymodactylos carnosus]
MRAEACHKWSKVLAEQDFDDFITVERGGKREDAFWNVYPDLEMEARLFVYDQCAKKEASFTADTLARFIDARFYEITNTKKVATGLIRSVGSWRLDIRHFGVKYTGNQGRPYFLGHEREDVVKHREEFVKYFIEH